MVDAGKVYLKTIPVVVEVSVADNWYENVAIFLANLTKSKKYLIIKLDDRLCT